MLPANSVPLFFDPGTGITLVRGTRAGVLRTVHGKTISNIWRCEDIDPRNPGLAVSRRTTNRPLSEGGRGPGGALMHQAGGTFMSTPENILLLKSDTDPTFIRELRRRELLFDTRPVTSLDDIYAQVCSLDLPLYANDGYGNRFDRWSVNPHRSFIAANQKSRLKSYVGERFRPVEQSFDLRSDSITLEDIARLSLDGSRPLFLKSDNGEQAATGVIVIPAGDVNQMHMTTVHRYVQLRLRYRVVNAKITAYQAQGGDADELSPLVILQRGSLGENRSFSVWLDPSSPSVMVIGLTEKLYSSSGASRGNYICPATPAAVRPIGPAICALVAGIRAAHPNAFGVLKCDYFHSVDDEVHLYDIGLRPSATTPGTLLRLRFEELGWGTPPFIQGDFAASSGTAGLAFAHAARRLRELFDPEHFLKTGCGAIPMGWNHIQGCGRFIVFGRDRTEQEQIEQIVTIRLAQP